MSSRIDFEYREAAFNLRMLTFAIINRDHIDIKEFLVDAYSYFELEIEKVLNIHLIVKVNCVFSATFEKDIIQSSEANQSDMRMEIDGEEDNVSATTRGLKEKQTLYIHTSSIAVGQDTQLEHLFKESVIDFTIQKVDEAMLRGSGFRLSTINELIVQVNKLDPLKGSSYIRLPKTLADKKGVINVKNDDNMCFKWAVLSALHPMIHAERKANYIRYEKELDFTGIEFPVQVKHISKFEQLNQTISINVYMYEGQSGMSNTINR